MHQHRQISAFSTFRQLNPTNIGQYSCIQDLFDPADYAALQAHLDAVRMRGGSRKNILDDAFGQFAGALILFLDDPHTRSRFNIRSVIHIHSHISEIHTLHTPKYGKDKNISNAPFRFYLISP
jgi:hypothetical protein